MASELEHEIDFGASGNSQSFLGAGWALPEPMFTWALGMQSVFRIPVRSDDTDYILTLDVVPFVVGRDLPAQRLIVSVNDVVVGSCAIVRPSLLAYRIPSGLARESGALVVTLQHPDAARPSEYGISGDHRLLTVSVAKAALHRWAPSGTDHRWRLPPGVTIGGTESPDFGLPRFDDLAGWLAHRAGLDFPALALRFESIGENCEFGLVQRRCDAEPLGLLRFSSTFLRPLIKGLDDDFENLGKPDDIDPRLEGNAPREYMIHETQYGLVYHSFVYEGQHDIGDMRVREARRLTFLRRKFIEELEAAEKIFVYKRNAPVSDEEVLALFLALRRRGANTLLWVVPAERNRPAGTVEVMMPGLLKGYIDRFAPEDNAHDFSFGGWIKLCANASVLAGLSKQ